jgi:hypothetical protein
MFPLGTILCEYATAKEGKEVQWSQTEPVVWFTSISDDNEGNYHIPLKFFESMVSMFSGSMVSTLRAPRRLCSNVVPDSSVTVRKKAKMRSSRA